MIGSDKIKRLASHGHLSCLPDLSWKIEISLNRMIYHVIVMTCHSVSFHVMFSFFSFPIVRCKREECRKQSLIGCHVIIKNDDKTSCCPQKCTGMTLKPLQMERQKQHSSIQTDAMVRSSLEYKPLLSPPSFQLRIFWAPIFFPS